MFAHLLNVAWRLRLLSKGVVFYSLCVSAGVVGVGCTQKGAVRSLPVAGQTSTQVVSPLTATVERPEKLRSINSLVVARPVFVRAVADRTLSEESLEGVVERIADEVLSLKVVRAADVLGNASASGLKLSPDGGSPETTKTLASLRARGVDAVLVTELSDYRERAGSSIGGEPATVSFQMAVKETSGGLVVWRAQYFYRQEALSENLLKLGDRLGSGGTGAGWVTGRVVFERGVDMALRDFGSRREALFLSAPPSQAPNGRR